MTAQRYDLRIMRGPEEAPKFMFHVLGGGGDAQKMLFGGSDASVKIWKMNKN